MKELLFPVIESAGRLHHLASWEDPFKSMVFLVLSCCAILWGWTRYILPSIFVWCAVLMLVRSKHCSSEVKSYLACSTSPGHRKGCSIADFRSCCACICVSAASDSLSISRSFHKGNALQKRKQWEMAETIKRMVGQDTSRSC
ncbi:hypothetical protein OIU84_020298 [Salix udensis]|uniref:Uncharacterized protein n=1 Tax=Salix udensis TaxID=889485 RepID=A0AAD6KS55_9ROSI|nr:hypothetical protein OIU84_020298 [Salix udensis]